MTTPLIDRTPTAPHDDPARCFVAIELSKKSWLVALLTPLSDKISLHHAACGRRRGVIGAA